MRYPLLVEQCLACGGEDINLRYCLHCLVSAVCLDHEDPMIHMTCQRCGFTWLVTPLYRQTDEEKEELSVS